MYNITITYGEDTLLARRIMLGNPMLSRTDAQRQLTAFRQMLGIDYSPGAELKCDFEINGKPCSVAITGPYGIPIEYTNFEEV